VLTLPEVVLADPAVLNRIKLHIYNTLLAVILPLAALQIPLHDTPGEKFMNGIPDGLIEAARVDGASLWATFPLHHTSLTRPISAAIAVTDPH